MEINISQHVLEVLEWPAIMEKIQGLCKTGPGKAYTENLRPLEREKITPRLRKISGLKEIILQDEGPDFSGIRDIQAHINLAVKEGVLSMEDLGQVKGFSLGSERIREFFRARAGAFPDLDKEYREIQDLGKLRDTLASALDDRNELRESAYPQLARIRDKTRKTKEEAEGRIARILSSPAMDVVLQEKIFTVRNERYVVMVKTNMKGRIKGTVHDISASGSTLYVEPDTISDLNDTILFLERELRNEILKILNELSRQVAVNAGPLENNLRVLAHLDFITAAARFSIQIRGNEQALSDKSEMVLYSARHPVLHIMDPEHTVSNYIELGSTFRGLIISGANTGGKTVLLKTIGLCALFTLYGLHVPAGPDSRVGYFTTVMADIGDDQNLSQSLSTFSGQITIIREMLERSDGASLVIIDEIIVGTNPRQGAALAQAILEQMIETGALIIVTTHYTELKDIASRDERFHNASVAFDMDTLRPTYKLQIGLPGVSYALEIAKNYGTPHSVIERAKSLLDSREISMEALIEKVNDEQRRIDEENLHLALLRESLDTERARLQEKERSLARERDNVKKQAGIDFLEELKRYRSLASQRISELQQAGLPRAGAISEEFRGIEAGVRQKISEAQSDAFTGTYRPVTAEELKSGDTVFVVPIEKEGSIEDIDIQGGRVTVLLGSSLKAQFRISEIMAPTVRRKKKNKKEADETARRISFELHPEESTVPLTIQTSYNTIDLRGRRVDEALAVMAADLDRMSRNGISSAVVIHGHGTGALKQAVRDYLKTSSVVSGFRVGEHGEGGDGVTIVSLRR